MTNATVSERMNTPVKPGALTEKVQEGLHEVRESTRNLYDRAKERAQVWEHNMEDKIREKPVKSVLIAAGVGAGIGLLLGFALARR